MDILTQFGFGQKRLPEPVIFSHQAPGNRAPVLTDAMYTQRPGTPGDALRINPSPTVRSNYIGPTDDREPLTRTRAEAHRVRAVRLQYVLVGGPACTAPNSRGWGWLHNYGYMTIADTLKPAQQLPRYTYAAIDSDTLLSRARASVLRTLYGR